jgi:hypothetical protein
MAYENFFTSDYFAVIFRYVGRIPTNLRMIQQK